VSISRRFVLPAILIAFVVYMSLYVIREARQLQALSGMIFFFVLEYITSMHPDRVCAMAFFMPMILTAL
jgi:hypothetical protein